MVVLQNFCPCQSFKPDEVMKMVSFGKRMIQEGKDRIPDAK
jgi:hypothetical protein